MKQWLQAFGMCQSMFCAIPSPWQGWEEKAREKMLLCLPLVGLEIGLLWWGLGLLSRYLPPMLAGAVLAGWPWLATGFLHLDGFLDVVDAVRSCRSLERRREILKDSHVGAFAVIGCVIVAMGQFAACGSFLEAPLGMLALIPVVSRCCAVMAVNGLPPMQTSQYANREKKKSGLILPGIMLLAALTAGFGLFGAWGLTLGVQALCFALALRRAYRSLGGMNGDISGYCITVSELFACAALAVGQAWS